MRMRTAIPAPPICAMAAIGGPAVVRERSNARSLEPGLFLQEVVPVSFHKLTTI